MKTLYSHVEKELWHRLIREASTKQTTVAKLIRDVLISYVFALDAATTYVNHPKMPDAQLPLPLVDLDGMGDDQIFAALQVEAQQRREATLTHMRQVAADYDKALAQRARQNHR